MAGQHYKDDPLLPVWGLRRICPPLQHAHHVQAACLPSCLPYASHRPAAWLPYAPCMPVMPVICLQRAGRVPALPLIRVLPIGYHTILGSFAGHASRNEACKIHRCDL